jgi:hypothetical protein
MKKGIEKEVPGEPGVAIGHGNQTLCLNKLEKQLNLPEWRKFTEKKAGIIQDDLTSPLSMDATTMYSCHLPELCIINSPMLYFKYFTRLPHKPPHTCTGKTTPESLVNEDASKTWTGRWIGLPNSGKTSSNQISHVYDFLP